MRAQRGRHSASYVAPSRRGRTRVMFGRPPRVEAGTDRGRAEQAEVARAAAQKRVEAARS